MASIYLVCYVLFPALILPFCRMKKSVPEVLLNKDETNVVKGISAIFIVLAHMVIDIEDNLQQSFILLKPITVLGGMGVLLFFFLSGYGIYKGYAEKKITISFLWKRIKSIFIPYVFLKFILLIVNVVLGYKEWNIDALKFLVTGEWFIEVIMIQYVLFYVAKKMQKLFRNKNSLVVFSFILTCMLGGLYIYIGRPIGYYNALLLFPFGMLVASKEEKLQEIKAFRRVSLLMLYLVAFAVTGALFVMFKGEMWANVFKTASGLFLSCLVLQFCQFVDVKSKPMQYFGKRSMYVYVIHVNIMAILSNVSDVDIIIKSLLMLVLTGIMMETCWIIYHKLEGWLTKEKVRQ